MKPSVKNSEMDTLRSALKDFAQEREWEIFHTSKNLAMALSVECSEVVEIFQWLTPSQSRELSIEQTAHLAEEVGDVMIYLTMLAAKHNLDPLACAQKKMVKNAKKYPV
jgi:NTP pyrophosphatase (non-canonical NTP hydrolase)